MTMPARRTMGPRLVHVRRLGGLLAVAAVLAGCGSGSSGGGSPAAGTSSGPPASDQEVRALAVTTLGLTGDPATRRHLQQRLPDSDPLVKLGQLLFFSQSLSAGYDVACATCHHPDFAGSDGLSISVGVAPQNPATVGPGREVDVSHDLDPSGGDGSPNMHRNSITTFNAALFDRALMYDGRVFVLDAATASGGHGQAIRTPESGQGNDLEAVDGLMEFTMKGPIVNDNEMRGFFYTDLATAVDYREHLVQRLRGAVDAQYNPRSDAPANWLQRFRAGFDQPDADAATLITMPNIQRALAAFIGSQIFVDTPWRRYLAGDTTAISATARQGAMLFLAARADGGLGCNACHAGDRFTDEAYHNVGFPQFGRGFGRSERNDLGRWLATRDAADSHAFRTPSLLNVALTAPYGHTGAFATLDDLLAYHANPRAAVDSFDFSLQQLQQFRSSNAAFPEAEKHTRDAIAQLSFSAAEKLLPARALSTAQIGELVAFLQALTDRCAGELACSRQWLPDPADDPDGHMLVRDHPQGTPAVLDAQRISNYPAQIALDFPAQAPRSTFADVQNCGNNLATAYNTGANAFAERTDAAFGLAEWHSYSVDTWFGPQQSTVEVAMIGGGISAAYVDDDCWPDLVFTGGQSGMRLFRNNAGNGFTAQDLLPADKVREFSGSAFADLNGDYRREMVLGNVNPGAAAVYGMDGTGQYQKVAELPTNRPTFGISFAPLDATGLPYLYLSHWSAGTGTNGGSPALWRSDGTSLYPWDRVAHTTSAFVDQRFNFTPKFADFTGDGRIDLVIASDFATSTVLRNVAGNGGGWYFLNETALSPITDENGMGSALLDIDNDGTLEWFVTSVRDHSDAQVGNWGHSGNRLYHSVSTAQNVKFTDITDQAGVRDGNWGWGACAADFNNDGFIDLFHVNGFGRIANGVLLDQTDESLRAQESDLQQYYNQLTGQFQDQPPRLFINNGNGTFTDQAAAWGIAVPSEGRGVACFDYDRDGDVDIVVFDHSNRPQFFENRSGSGPGHRFLEVRLVGAAPNTDAIGARVYVTADVGHGHGVQTQLRLAEANSNFNSQNLPDLYFGLGEAAAVSKLRVVWPGGAELICQNLAANRFLVLDQRAGGGTCAAAAP